MESAHQNCTAGRRLFLGLLGLLVIWGGFHGAEATVVVRVDLPELVKTSKWIVEGTVVGIQSQGEHTFGGIETQVELRVSHWWKGPRTQGNLLIRLPGGKRGELTSHVAGMPRFHRGEQVILFLEPLEGGVIPTGLHQGIFRVERGPEGAVVSQTLGAVHYVERGTAVSHGASRTPEDTSGVPLEQFRKEIEFYTPHQKRPFHRIEERGPAVLQ